jgi:hypothetical protein
MPSKLCSSPYINSLERDRYGYKRRRSDETANQPGRQSHVPGLPEEESPIRLGPCESLRTLGTETSRKVGGGSTMALRPMWVPH